MIAAIHQPAYLPWLGYFHKILRADVFVVLDTVQLEKNGFANRNRVWTPNGPVWLTVPIRMKGHTGKAIAEMVINANVPWQKKHLRTLEQSYGKCPFYGAYAPGLARVIEGAGERLAPLLAQMLAWFLEALEFPERKIVLASDLRPEGQRSELLLDICRRLGADAYLSGAAGRGYLDPAPFEAAGVAVRFQAFHHPVYDQGGGEFVPRLSAVDALFRLGGRAVRGMLEAAGPI